MHHIDYRKIIVSSIGRKSKRAYEDVRRKRQETAVLRAKQKEESKTLSESRKSGQSLKKEENEPEKRIDHKVSGVSFATTLMSEAEIPKKGRRKNKSPDVCELIPDNEAFVINREEPFMEAEPIRQEGKEQQYEALQQTDTFTPLEEKAEEDLQNQKNTSGRKKQKKKIPKQWQGKLRTWPMR